MEEQMKKFLDDFKDLPLPDEMFIFHWRLFSPVEIKKVYTFVAFDVFNGGTVGLYLNLSVVWHITQHTTTEVWAS